MTLKQRRNPLPTPQTDYRKYKPILREDFNYACTFCEIWESERGSASSFHIEHYRPKKIFPELVNEYSNLLYACKDCNWAKGQYWPGPLELFLNHYVLNPYEHHLNQEIDKSNHKWVGLTGAGRWNVSKFKLDSLLKIRKRKNRVLVRKWLSVAEQELEQKLALIQIAQEDGDTSQVSLFLNDVYEIQEKIDFFREQLQVRLDKEP